MARITKHSINNRISLQALVDGPKTFNGVERQMINFNDLQLTDFRLNIRLNARAKTITKALTTAKDGEKSVLDQWKATKWAKKIEGREVKASLTDLERFRAMRKRQAVRFIAAPVDYVAPTAKCLHGGVCQQHEFTQGSSSSIFFHVRRCLRLCARPSRLE